VGDNSDSLNEIKTRLQALDVECGGLKKERNQLTMQLLEAREEVVYLKNTASSSANKQNNSNSGSGPVNKFASLAVGDGAPDSTDSTSSSTNSSNETRNEKNIAMNRELSMKVIELENKIAVSAKRDVDMEKTHTNLQARTEKLSEEAEKHKAEKDDALRKLASLQTLYNHQLQVDCVIRWVG
jgi:hypothetical protein